MRVEIRKKCGKNEKTVRGEIGGENGGEGGGESKAARDSDELLFEYFTLDPADRFS
jgi:hypothetical protein